MEEKERLRRREDGEMEEDGKWSKRKDGGKGNMER